MDALDLYIYDVISDWDGITAQSVARQLADYGSVGQVNVRINSYGGDVWQGFAIYNALARHQGRVTVHIDGLAASIASVIAQAGDERLIAEAASVMVHAPTLLSWGDADELRDQAALLDGLHETCAAIYAARSGTSQAEWSALMKDGDTYYHGTEAVEAGLADRVVSNKAPALVPEPLATARLAPRATSRAAIARAATNVRGTAYALSTPTSKLLVPVAQLQPRGTTSPDPSDPQPTAIMADNPSTLARIKAELGITASDDFDAVAEARALKVKAEQADELEKEVETLTAETDRLETELGEAQTRVEELEAAEDERMLDQAVAEFRIKKADRPKHEQDLAANRAQARAVLAALPKDAHKPGSVKPDAPEAQGGEAPVTITTEDARDPHAYRKAKAEAKKRGVRLEITD
ncbi:MAG: head maturation protease, ClpP-related [Bacteroidota bacterium]